MQVCHGKAAPLRRISPGDTVIYYSPTALFAGRDRLRAFTARGVVRAGAPYAVDMGGGFRPYRRDVDWQPGTEAPIGRLLDSLEFTRGRPNWGYQLRFGLFAISAADSARIEAAMLAAATPDRPSAPAGPVHSAHVEAT